MYSTSLIRVLNVKSILSMVSEYDIFKYYINEDFTIGKTIHSPLRKDENPSFMIYKASYGSYALRFMDHSTSDQGSCFDLVMIMYNCDFMTALRLIDRDFRLGIASNKIDHSIVPKSIDIIEESSCKRCSLEVGIRNWDITKDKGYWGSFGITGKTLQQYNVYPLSHYRLEGHEYKCKELTYGYYFGDEMWKIYCPSQIKGKWLSNTNLNVLQGYSQLPSNGDLLVITKSLKDVMVYSEIGVNAVAPQSESILIKESIITDLKGRFKDIVLNFDFDYAGIRNGCRYKRKYKLRCLYFTNGRFGLQDFKVKDAAEYVSRYGINKLKELVQGLK